MAGRFAGFVLMFMAAVALAEDRAIDIKSEFRGVRFGADLTADPEFREVGYLKNGDDHVYRRASDKMMLGPVRLFTLDYHAYKGRFWFASMTVLGDDDAVRVLTAAFGEPTRSEKGIKHEWLGKALAIVCYLPHDSMNTVIEIRGVQFDAAVQADKNKAAASGKGDF